MARTFLLAAALALLGACSRSPGPDIAPPRTDAPGDTSPGRGAIPDAGTAPVYVDPATGCQYFGYSSHGLTPRMSGIGPYRRQLGCRHHGQ